ncbi:tudor domain-containing protein 3 [Pyrus ussuriensis x Pyrus communis]|uniref:Tudor domain-containing protein 3 n=1 Tax=Pyrus ussuriensis x Pyrus communis TaxID=2448454 RepID=A0A5N5GQH5_9ROSA|nr:tudor domain-containing protein 3 [Pyrus ussuriensis x Pyrus communis]
MFLFFFLTGWCLQKDTTCSKCVLLGPKKLNMGWGLLLLGVRDVTKSRVEGFTRNTSSRRLLKLGLTDNHGEVAAVEYSHIPAIPDDVVPGTKVFSGTD